MIGHNGQNKSEVKVFVKPPGEVNVAFMGERRTRGGRYIACRLQSGPAGSKNGIVRNKPSAWKKRRRCFRCWTLCSYYRDTAQENKKEHCTRGARNVSEISR